MTSAQKRRRRLWWLLALCRSLNKITLLKTEAHFIICMTVIIDILYYLFAYELLIIEESFLIHYKIIPLLINMSDELDAIDT